MLGVPFTIMALWAVTSRPVRPTVATSTLAHRTVREGEATTWTAVITAVPGIDLVSVAMARGPWWRLSPRSGAVCVAAPRRPPDTADAAAVPTVGDVRVSIALQSTKWGRRDIGPAVVGATSMWAAFRSGPVAVASLSLTTLPIPAVFDTTAPVPISSGLIGLNRSSYRGEGMEFASIRPFTVGDRIRRIQWPVSLRAGTLHVASTFTDRDTQVVLVLDAGNDVGPSEGVGGAASSLDLSVRGAGAIAEHFLRRGDRVGLRTFGSARSLTVNAAGGTGHLRRLLRGLALVEASGSGPTLAGFGRTHPMPGGLVIMLSPLLSRTALDQAVVLASHRLPVMVVDTLPADIVGAGDAHDALAWRIRLLERQRDVQRLQEQGIPVAPWRGPGSIDQVLRDLRRRIGAPRMVRR